MESISINMPLTAETIKKLRVGDKVLLSGTLYTARDAAHKKLKEAIEKEKKLPFLLEGQVIYYTGPTPAPPGRPLGSCGPTSSYRMDSFTPLLLEKGLKGMIGKGERSPGIVEAIRQHQAVYFAAIGGAGALLAEKIQKAKVIAYNDLGPEAIHELQVVDFPVIVAIDAQGNNIYQQQ